LSLKFNWITPTKIYFGQGSINKLGDEASKLGSKALIITSKGWTTKRRIFFDELAKNLTIKYEIYDEVKTNPTTNVVDKIVSHFEGKGVDLVIGFGGGSSIDVAKAVALIIASGGSSKEYLFKIKEPKDSLPIIAIPTTHGTGSEVDKYAVLTDPETHAKAPIISTLIYPKVTIVEPKFATTIPQLLTISTTIDALSHALESYISRHANIFSRMYAREAIHIIYNYLPKVIKDPSNIEIRGKLLWSSLCAGIAIDQSRAGLLHALEHPLSSYYNIHHGLGLYILFIPWLEYTLDYGVREFAEIARLINPKLYEVEDYRAAKEFLNITKKFFQQLEIKVKLSDYGVREEDLPTLANNAVKYLKPLVENNPRKPSSIDELINIYRKAL